jgi:hypothetical protein
MSADHPTIGVFVVAAAIATAACSSVVGPEPADSNWHTFEGPHVTFFVRPGSFGEQSVAQLSAAVEDQYAATLRALGLTYQGRVRAYAYNSGADANLPTDGAGHAYPNTESFVFIAAPPLGGGLYTAMDHEANHVFVMDSLGSAGTYAMTEGLASALLSDTYNDGGRRLLYPWTHRNRSQLPELSRLFDDEQWGLLRDFIVYNSSASFLAWLLDTYGAERLRAIYGASSSQMADRMAAVYGRSMAQLETDWLQFCDQF